MKVNKLFLCLSILFLASCSNNSTSSSNQANSESSGSNDVILDENPIVTIINNSLESTQARIDYSVYKDNVRYLNIFEIYTYNETLNVSSKYSFTTRMPSLDESQSKVSEVYTTYYDGEYSYTSDSDNMYKKIKDSTKPSLYKLEYSFKNLSNIELNNSSFEATVEDNNINSFFNTTMEEVSNVKVNGKVSNQKLEELSLAYNEKGFKVEVTYKFSYAEQNITIPESIYIK